MKKFTIYLCLFLFITPFVGAQRIATSPIDTDLSVVDKKIMSQIDNEELHAEEMKNREAGELPHFAYKFQVEYNQESHGTWEYLNTDMAVWRLRIYSAAAKSLNFGFSQFKMPANAKLILYTADLKDLVGPLTSADNKEHERLWTPIVLGDDVIIEVQMPRSEVADFALAVSEVNHDFMGINSLMSTSACHIDVNCGTADGYPQIEAYRDQIQGVAMYTLNGDRTCSGVLINNTNQDCRPFFLTANHCSISTDNASTIVAYWNYQNSSCRELGSDESGADGNGDLTVFNTGAQLRASTPRTDMALIEFDNAVPDNANAFFAGWNRLEALPSKVVGIHHPQSMEKRISFVNDASVFQGDNNGDADENGNYLVLEDWDLGVTEVGSSGSPLFDQDGFVIGQLFGGLAYDDVNCSAGEQTDFYGWVFKSWEGAGSSDTRLRDWLDPQGTGETILAGKYQDACNVLAITDIYQTVCALDDNQVAFDLTAGSGAGNVALSVVDKPGAITAAFGSTSLQANESTTLTLGNLGALSTGDYKIEVQANFGSDQAQYFIYLELLQDVPTAAAINEPTNGSTDAQLTQTLSWGEVSNTKGYDVMLSDDNGFQNIIAEASDVVGTSYLPSVVLNQGTTYYWRVRGTNGCGVGEWSPTASFTTLDNDFQGCITLNAIDLPITIEAADSGDYPSTINFPFGSDTDVVEKIRLTDIKGEHTWIGDLTFRLESPKGTVITLLEEECFDSEKFEIGFDDLSPFPLNDLDCPFDDNVIYTPQDSLVNFRGENPNGDWKLTVVDGVPDDGGVFNSWTIEICLSNMVPTRDLIPANSIKLYPNPARNTVFLAIDHQISASKIGMTVFNIQGSQLMRQQLDPSNRTELDVSQLAPGMYLVQLQFEDQMINKKLIIH